MEVSDNTKADKAIALSAFQLIKRQVSPSLNRFDCPFPTLFQKPLLPLAKE